MDTAPLAKRDVENLKSVIRNTCSRYALGEYAEKMDAWRAVCSSMVQDSRVEIVVTFANFLPLPTEANVMEGATHSRQQEILATLPHLYSAWKTSPSFHGKALAEKAVRRKTFTEMDIMNELDLLVTDIRDHYPVWYLLANHVAPEVQLATLKRIPAEGNVLSPLVYLLARAPSRLVRHEARRILGLPVRASWRRHEERSWQVGKAVHLIARGEIADTATDAPYLIAAQHAIRSAAVTDSRERVRFAFALTLTPEAPEWMTLARDRSKRVRRVAAGRVLLSSIEAGWLLADENPLVAKIMRERRGVAYERGEPYKPETPAMVDKELARIHWAQQFEESVKDKPQEDEPEGAE